ncbi:unnamed protein product [Hydatigera taeniaeformis]|uniref:DUF4283 domain-containing protein n=1 Tax=Hydatigena taeniaeformis TaxID=6205 RepID=A0A0R3X8Q1_HYDTA|nr:unnamed protein product [Hydatigera taeniaeformis]
MANDGSNDGWIYASACEDDGRHDVEFHPVLATGNAGRGASFAVCSTGIVTQTCMEVKREEEEEVKRWVMMMVVEEEEEEEVKSFMQENHLQGPFFQSFVNVNFLKGDNIEIIVSDARFSETGHYYREGKLTVVWIRKKVDRDIRELDGGFVGTLATLCLSRLLDYLAGAMEDDRLVSQVPSPVENVYVHWAGAWQVEVEVDVGAHLLWF